MRYRFFNVTEAYDEWKDSIVEASKNIDENTLRGKEKLQWMSSLLTIKENIENSGSDMYESYGSQTPQTVGAMGSAKFPDVGTKAGAWFQPDYSKGSGDIPNQKMAIAMNVASYTIGLELLPVIPSEFPLTMYSYLDHVYGGGRLDTDTNPIYIGLSGEKVSEMDKTAFKYAQVVYLAKDSGADGDMAIKTKFMGTSRWNGDAIFKIEEMGKIGTALAFIAEAKPRTVIATFEGMAGEVSIFAEDTANTLTATGKVALESAKPDLVSAIDDHIEGFSNRDGVTKRRMTRAEGEKGTENTINLRLFSTAVEAGTIEVLATIGKTQLKDLQVYGINGMAQIYKAAQNELTQKINKEILRDFFRLGVSSHYKLNRSQGVNLNLFVAPASVGNKALSAFPIEEFVDITEIDRAPSFGNIRNSETNSASENMGTRQRRISSRILAASALISTVGRYGKGDIAVVNNQIASALMDNKNFQAYASDNNVAVDTRNLYYIGTVNGVAVYCDPLMKWHDTRIAVGRKGTEDSPGLKFLPYDLASSVETLSETSMSPKICLTSRYSLIHAGYHPESQYLTFAINTDFESWV